MNQLTIRGLDPALVARLRELSEREGISLNKAALRLLRKGAGLETPARADVVGSSLDHLFGTWSQAEVDEFEHAVEIFEQVDESLWR